MNIKLNKLTFLLLITFVAFTNCKEATTKVTEKVKTIDAANSDSLSVAHFYTSTLRPNEELQLGKVYTDTVNYVAFLDDYDYLIDVVEKDKETVNLIHNIEHKERFDKGDRLRIQWKMDSLRPAGDPEFLDYVEYLISSSKLDAVTTNKSLKIDTYSSIDSVSISEIKSIDDQLYPSIFGYYALQQIDEVEVWSDKMFGRCCTEADLSYSELLYFDIKANTSNDLYPYTYLSDQNYSTAFAFNQEDEIAIDLTLQRDNEIHKYHTGALLDDLLKTGDTLLKPFKLSLVNGYTKSDKTFTENARVKTLQVYLNKEYKATVQLLDTPSIQEFKLDFPFFKNDTITLKPITFYVGTKYDDVCISEIQSSLTHITHPSINDYYNIQELRNMNQVIQD